jgi:hypothetical protein
MPLSSTPVAVDGHAEVAEQARDRSADIAGAADDHGMKSPRRA